MANELEASDRLTPADGSKLSRIEDSLDKDRAGSVSISVGAGGLDVVQMRDVMDFAKLMALSQQAVPPHCRGFPGVCLAVTVQAVEWKMSPFAVANKSYVVNDRLAYESQLIHAIVEARAPIKERLDCTYDGEGPDRVCIVTGVFRDGAVREYRSPRFKDIKVKNSPLWAADPDQQLWFYSSRAWARKWCPDVLMGIYSKEELEEAAPMTNAQVASGLLERLPGKIGDGFEEGSTEIELAAAIDPDPDGLEAKARAEAEKATRAAAKESRPKGRGKARAAPVATAEAERLV